MDEKILQYIKRNLESGHDIEKIKQALVKAGHNPSVVKEHADSLVISKKRPKSGIWFIVLAAMVLLLGAYFLSPLILNKRADVDQDKNSSGNSATARNSQEAITPEDISNLNNALISKSEEACGKISNSELQAICLNKGAVQNETCDAACMDKKLINSALINQNASFCDGIGNKVTKDECVRILNP